MPAIDQSSIRQSIGLPPTETVEFFRAKGYLPAKYREHWDDIWQQEHARWFTVTKLFNNQLLEEVRRSLDKVLSEGGTFEQWRAAILPKLSAPGVEGVDPRLLTSVGRLRIIYDTNLRTARAAGKWKRIQALKERAPYLLYDAVKDRRTRPLHRIWGGLDTGKPVILEVDDPWWDTHYPPCGWNCRCGVIQLSDRDLRRHGWSVTPPPDDGPPHRYQRSDGTIVEVPAGIDPGFAYNPGKDYLRALSPVPLEQMLEHPRIRDMNVEAPPMPPPRVARPEDILPADITPEDAARRFLAAFEPRVGTSGILLDELEEPVVINQSMVTDRNGRLKVSKLGRQQFALLVARALMEPDEIWYEWIVPDPTKEARTGKLFVPRLRRRYVARFLVDGVERAVFAALDFGTDGWEGRTWFAPERGIDYLDQSVRSGVLAWRRGNQDPAP